MVCFLISLMSVIVSTKFHGNTLFLRGRGRKKAGGGVGVGGMLPPPDLRSYKFSGLMGLNLYSFAILIVDLSFDIDLEF